MNLLQDSKPASPPVPQLEHNEAPEWRSGARDRSRVPAGVSEDQPPHAPAQPLPLLRLLACPSPTTSDDRPGYLLRHRPPRTGWQARPATSLMAA